MVHSNSNGSIISVEMELHVLQMIAERPFTIIPPPRKHSIYTFWSLLQCRL